jgi:Short C-terminal domain/Phospholipase_D-nuclease N-terminal
MAAVLLAADYPFLDVLGTMLVFFGFVVWFWLLIRVFADVFRRHDIGGGAKFLWSLFVILVPLLGVLVYLIAEGRKMGERDVEAARAQQAEVDAYIRETAANGGPTGEIAKAKRLLDSGAISQAEFDQIKQKALA